MNSHLDIVLWPQPPPPPLPTYRKLARKLVELLSLFKNKASGQHGVDFVIFRV